MKDNNRSLSAALLTVCVLLCNVVLGQNSTQDFAIALDSNTDSSKPVWKVGLDVSSTTAGLLGATNSRNMFFGVQVDRRVNQWALRLAGRYYPAYYSAFPNSRAIRVVGAEVEYLSIQNQGWLSEVRIGFERSRLAGIGRAYLALDATFLYGQRDIQARTYLSDPTAQESGDISGEQLRRTFSSPRSEFRTETLGVGLIPTIGYSFYFSKHIGIDVEGRVGASVIQSQGYAVEDDATITKSANVYTLRFSQLLSLRLHYRF
ncbi:MAG: hypothetical protein Salg2KO_05300 [Salibacteraceae bacterium]